MTQRRRLRRVESYDLTQWLLEASRLNWYACSCVRELIKAYHEKSGIDVPKYTIRNIARQFGLKLPKKDKRGTRLQQLKCPACGAQFKFGILGRQV